MHISGMKKPEFGAWYEAWLQRPEVGAMYTYKSRDALERYEFGLAKSVADIPRLLEIHTGKVLERWPDYWQQSKVLGDKHDNGTLQCGNTAHTHNVVGLGNNKQQTERGEARVNSKARRKAHRQRFFDKHPELKGPHASIRFMDVLWPETVLGYVGVDGVHNLIPVELVEPITYGQVQAWAYELSQQQWKVLGTGELKWSCPYTQMSISPHASLC